MATKVHGCGGKKNHQQQRKEKMDKELTEIRVRMEELALRVQQSARTRWVYEWPLRRKEKWLVKKLLARGQRRLLRRWSRYMKSLRATEEMVHACEPEAGRNLSDDEEERSLEDLVNCQGGSEESSICKEGNEMGSLDDLRDCQVSSKELLDCQVGNVMRSLEDLIEFQVGRGKEMRLSKSLMNSEESSYQQGVLTGEGQKSILMIGGIKVFLTRIQDEAREDVAGLAVAEGQPTMTIMMKEKISEFSQGEEGEHSEEWLKYFSQVAGTKTPVALEAVAEEEHTIKMLTPWDMELEMLEDWLNNLEPVDDC
jgi:hypothetical protein